MSARKCIQMKDKIIGDGYPVFIVLEAGATHNGLESALKLVEVAAETGADAVKFQLSDVDRLMSNKSVPFSYKILADRETGRVEEVTEPLDVILRRREMPREDWAAVKKRADELNLLMFCTAVFPETVEWLVEMGIPSIKVASGDINHTPFIRSVGKHKVCVQLDTGASTLGEVERAVDTLLGEGNDQIIIHHCPSGYPAYLEGINLNIITTLKQMFEYPIAFSDHSPGWEMDIAAVALGANLVEKTITLDKTTRSCEHMFSLEPHEVKAFIQAIRSIEVALGTKRRLMSPEERVKKLAARRSLVLTRDLGEGEKIELADIDFKRPGTGISPEYLEQALGLRVNADLKAGSILSWSDLI